MENTQQDERTCDVGTMTTVSPVGALAPIMQGAVLAHILDASVVPHIAGARRVEGPQSVVYLEPESSDIQLNPTPGSIFTIGRNRENDLALVEFPDVSRRHARIAYSDGYFTLCDLKSLCGTFLNEQRLPENRPQLLVSGDGIRFGSTALYMFLTCQAREDLAGRHTR